MLSSGFFDALGHPKIVTFEATKMTFGYDQTVNNQPSKIPYVLSMDSLTHVSGWHGAGLPRIFTGLEEADLPDGLKPTCWDPFMSEYISNSRININVRHVSARDEV